MNDFLLQRDWRTQKLRELGTENWVHTYLIDDNEKQKIALFSALIPKDQVADVLKESSWDISIGDGLPGEIIYYEDGLREIQYTHFTDAGAIQPLVLVRGFHGIKTGYVEILEEFRLFHNLYHDIETNRYIKIFDNGDEDEVIRIKNKSVEIRLRELRQFISWKNMVLALYFDIDRFSDLPLETIDKREREDEYSDEQFCYGFFVDRAEMFTRSQWKTFSRLHGKKLIYGPPVEESGIWSFEKPKEYEEFIIKTDSNGNEIIFSANPDNLANYFGANPDNPHYLTSVFFRREILTRYYSESDKYTVHDGRIEKNGIWSLRVDNHHPNYIIVFLGDLGRDIPYSEQRIWRTYNVVPDGTLSEVTARRAFLGEFAEPVEPSLKFKSLFKRFQESWNNKFKWFLFKHLTPEDNHHFIALHTPISDSQAEFDSQILSLTKILIDSLNEGEITKLITTAIPSNSKGISKFEIYLKQEMFPQVENVIKFMRTLQDIRSESAAHRKGSDYNSRIRKSGVDPTKLKNEFEKLLQQAIDSLIQLQQHFLDSDDET